MLSKWPTAATPLGCLPARCPTRRRATASARCPRLRRRTLPLRRWIGVDRGLQKIFQAVVASCMLSFVPTAWRAGRKSQRWGKSRILSYFVRLVTATRGPLPADVRHVSSPWVLHNAATPPRTRRVLYATSHRSILAQDRAGGGQAQAGRDRVASASPASPPRGHRDAYAAATISSLPTYVRIRAELKSSTFRVLRGASRRPAPTTSSCSAYGDRRSRSRGNPRAER